MIIAAAACFCAVVITNGTGNKQQAAVALQQLNAMNGAMLVKQVFAMCVWLLLLAFATKQICSLLEES